MSRSSNGLPALILGAALAASTAIAQTGSSTGGGSGSSSGPGGQGGGTTSSTSSGQVGNASNTTSFSNWMSDFSKAHSGRISRQAYMDEMGRRWDAADQSKQGLSMDEINRLYGWSSGAGASINVTGQSSGSTTNRETKSQ